MTHEKRLAVLERGVMRLGTRMRVIPLGPDGHSQPDTSYVIGRIGDKVATYATTADGYEVATGLFDTLEQAQRHPHDEWQRRLDEWRTNPGTVVLICPACNALRGLHRLTCELR